MVKQTRRDIETRDATVRAGRLSQQRELKTDPASDIEPPAARRKFQCRNGRAQD
jgi:hypothetical protein